MAASIMSKDRVARQREEALAILTGERVRLAEALEKVIVEISDLKRALLEARDKVEVIERWFVEIAGEATFRTRVLMMKEYKSGGANA